MASTKNKSGTVKQSTMILVAAVTFAVGLYSGYLLSAIKGDPGQEQAVQKRQVVPQTPDEGRPEDSIAMKMAKNPESVALEQAARNDPKNPEAWNRLGHWYFDHDMPKDAIRAYEASLVLKPRDPDIITNMGVMHRELHNHDKALELFDQAATLDPSHPQSRFNKGIVLFFDMGKKKEGLAAWEEVKQIDSQFRVPSGATITQWLKQYS